MEADLDYVLSFDPGGSSRSWAYALSSVRFRDTNAPFFGVLETGFVPVLDDLARPNFECIKSFSKDLCSRWGIGSLYSCDLVAERYVGRGHTGSLNEMIPFHLGFWASHWLSLGAGGFRAIMASQWKLKAKRWNNNYCFDLEQSFENWWEDYYAYFIPQWDLKRSKSCERHIQDACAIGWYYWRFEKKINCLPEGIKELVC